MRTMQFDYTQTPYWERPLCTLLRAFIEDQIHITKQTLNLIQILIHILDQSEGWSGWRNSNLAMRSVAADGETPSPSPTCTAPFHVHLLCLHRIQVVVSLQDKCYLLCSLVITHLLQPVENFQFDAIGMELRRAKSSQELSNGKFIVVIYHNVIT